MAGPVKFEVAAEYAGRRGLEAMLAVRDGDVIFERYALGFDADTPHALYSGTKSFWGVAAVAAREDGLLDLDETVGATFPAWSEGRRGRVTLRHLLQLTSGIGFGGLGNAVPPYAKALAVEPKDEPGETFTYGGIPLQIFGAVLAAKLSARPGKPTPQLYLRERILEPIGCEVASWRTLKDGAQPLPTGAFLSARNWARYGALMAAGGHGNARPVVSAADIAACLTGSGANPRYGLGWWLSPLANAPELFYASGSGGQALYVFPDTRTAIVRFSKNSSLAHSAFLGRLFA
jgi:CubicO group peptidase (beta-lactamase class C family)